MFSTSTQRKHWTFTGETQITQNKKDANQKYVNKYGGSNLDVSTDNISKAIKKIFCSSCNLKFQTSNYTEQERR